MTDAKPLTAEELAEIRARDAQWTGGNPICKSCMDVRKLLAHVAYLTAELDALKAHPALVVPDGWKLVPVEPTEGMLAAGVAAALQQRGQRPWCPPCYSAMLAAAPQPQKEGE